MRIRAAAFAAVMLAATQFVTVPSFAAAGGNGNGQANGIGSGRGDPWAWGTSSGRGGPLPLLGATGLGQLAAVGAGAFVVWRRRRRKG
jgi:uncharacterized membrane protein YphA (DoxX/SURF4 family)